MKIWKRNAVVAAIVLFVCAAVYLNWSYTQGKSDVSADALPSGKLLGGTALVGASAQPQDSGSDLLVSPAPSDAAGGEMTASPAPSASQAPANDYFSNARINRQQARDSALSLLEEAAANNEADQTMRDEANASIQVMADCTLAEAQIEGLVTAKGFTDCVAFVGEDSASIVVSAVEGGLTETDTAKIMEIVMDQTALQPSQIKIIPAE